MAQIDFEDSDTIAVAKKNKSMAKCDGDENLHEGHRQRVYAAVDRDPLLDTFSEVETLEYALFAALPRVNTNEIAHRLLRSFGSLVGVFSAPIDALAKIKGMSKRAAYFLKSIPMIARKSQLTRVKPENIKSVTGALDYLKSHFDNIYRESMYVMCLDSVDKLLGVDRIAFGGTATGSAVAVPIIVESALHHHATKVIVAHNHPNGVLVPSKEDISVSDLMIDSLAALDVVLVDHIIFTPEDNYMSFFNSGLIEIMYTSFDSVHNTNLSAMLIGEKRHALSSGNEYLFNLEEMTAMKKDDYDKYMRDRYFKGITRTELERKWDIFDPKK